MFDKLISQFMTPSFSEQPKVSGMCVISTKTYKGNGESEFHSIEINSSWKNNPYKDTHVIVPENMVNDIMATKGYCDFEVNEEGTHLVSFTPREIPEEPKIEPKPKKKTELELLREEVEVLKAKVDLLMAKE